MKIQTVISCSLLAIVYVAWSISVRPFVPAFSVMEPLLATTVVLSLLQKRQAAWLVGMIGAVGIDLFRLEGLPILTLFMVLYLVLLQFVSGHVLSTRSFYSAFSLLAFGRLIAWFLLWVSHERYTLWPMPYGLHYGWQGIVIQLVLDAAWVFVWYSIVSYWARRGPERYKQPRWH